MDTPKRYNPNSIDLNGGRDRTRTCDLLRVNCGHLFPTSAVIYLQMLHSKRHRPNSWEVQGAAGNGRKSSSFAQSRHTFGHTSQEDFGGITAPLPVHEVDPQEPIPQGTPPDPTRTALPGERSGESCKRAVRRNCSRDSVGVARVEMRNGIAARGRTGYGASG